MQTTMQPVLLPTALPIAPPPMPAGMPLPPAPPDIAAAAQPESLFLSRALPSMLEQLAARPTVSRAGAPAISSVAPAAMSSDPDAPGRGDGLIPASPGDGVTIGKVKLNAYGGILALAGIAGTAVAARQLRSSGVATAGLGKVLAPAVVAGLVGARLYHVATDWDRYRDDLGDIPKVWEGGMGIYGGVAAGLGTAAILAHRAKLPIAPLLDAAAIGLPVAQALGRFGNYANQELYGKPTDLPWGLQVDPDKRPDEFGDRNSFHPTFAYEAGWNIALAGGLFGLSKVWTGRPAGILLPMYLAGYGIGRFAVEGLRIDESREFGGLRTNQWTSLAVTGAGLIGTAAMLARR